MNPPRAARRSEIQTLVDLANRVFYPDGSGRMGEWFPPLFSEENAENLRIVTDGTTPVSMVGLVIRDAILLGGRIRLAMIGSVCTIPSFRGKGLASLLMDDATSRALAQGASVMLVSGGRGLYQRMGLVDAGLYQTVQIPRDARLPTQPSEPREWREEDLPDILRSYQEEPVRFVRSAGEFRALLDSKSLRCKPATTWVISSGGKILAYLCAQRPVEESGSRVVKVEEIAGSRLAILSALPKLFESYGVDRIDIDTIASDRQMECLVLAHRLTSLSRGFEGTIKIINPPAFFQSLAGYLEERISRDALGNLRITHTGGKSGAVGRQADAEEMVFAYRGSGLHVRTAPDLAALVFGSTAHEAPAAEGAPLAELLRTIFPLPLVQYGLSYI